MPLALAQFDRILILGNSIVEGVGTALLIPPVHVLTTLLVPELGVRPIAWSFVPGLLLVGYVSAGRSDSAAPS